MSNIESVLEYVLLTECESFIEECSNLDIDSLMTHIYFKALLGLCENQYPNYVWIENDDVWNILTSMMNVKNFPLHLNKNQSISLKTIKQ